MKKNYLACFLLLLLSACGSKETCSVSLSGEIKGLGNDTLYLCGADRLYDRMDTLVVKDDRFSVELSADTLFAAWLLFGDGTEYPLYLNKGDEIHIKGTAADLSVLEVTGNESNEEQTAFLKDLAQSADASGKSAAEKAEAFITTHPASLVSIYLLERYFMQQPRPDFAHIRMLANRMTGDLKDRPYMSEVMSRLQEEEKIAVGKTAPYFGIMNAENKKITRSDFKSQYLLIHFWASWDRESRTANDSLRQIYNREQRGRKKTEDRKWAFLGISLDTDREAWQEAVKSDTLGWEQTCDFSGWNAEIVRQFAVSALPANVLLSPAGRIEGLNLSKEAIERKIEEIDNLKK